MREAARDDEAEALTASEGGSAMLVRRWYFLDNAKPLLISRSVYPRAGLVSARNRATARYLWTRGRGNPASGLSVSLSTTRFGSICTGYGTSVSFGVRAKRPFIAR